jgi:hypothetical protein
LNEDLFRNGFIDEKTYLMFKERYRRKLVDIVKANREKPASVKVEVKTATFQASSVKVEKEEFVNPEVYAKMSDQELIEAFKYAQRTNDLKAIQKISSEAKRRGYRIKEISDGNVQIIRLR